MKFKRSILVLTVSIILIFGNNVFCQNSTNARIENIDFELINNKLIINYDIANAENGERFYVWIRVYNSFDVEIIAHTLSGDVNSIISGGTNKNIIWNLYKDFPDFNDDIYIKVFASKYLSYERLLLQSAAFPGYGNYQINKDKKNWIIGAVTYSCLFSSVIFEQIAQNTYNKYTNELVPQKRDDLFDLAYKQRKISNIFLITTATLWVGNLGYTFWDKQDYDKELRKNKVPILSVSYNINQNFNDLPVLTAKINF